MTSHPWSEDFTKGLGSGSLSVVKFATNLLVRQSAVKDLLTSWVTLGILLLYFGVPWLTSVLASAAILGQATMGSFVLRAILPRFPQSMLSLLGPGMILGSAVSVAVFHIVGRGSVGLVVVAVCCVFTVSRHLNSQADPGFNDARLRLSLRLLCVACLSLAWEFPEVLPAAIGLLLWDVGLMARARTSLLRLIRFVCLLTCVALIIRSLVGRSEYWWLITDDYKFYEALMQHLVSNGPLDNLGQLNPARYHWLSYGWSGLVDELAGNPEPLVTLARVIPSAYTVSLAASLLLAAKVLRGRSHVDLQTYTFVLAIVALNRLDWSGTSTAGVFAVLAGMAATIIIAICDRHSTGRRTGVEVIFLLIVLLTKFPSVFVAAAIIFSLEANRLAMRRGKSTRRLSTIITVSSTALVFASVPIASSVVGLYTVGRFNPSIGQLANFGPDFAALGLVLQHLPIILVILLPWMSHRFPATPAQQAKRFVNIGAIALVPFAILMDVTIIGNANTSDYFSDPIWFVASLAMFVLPANDNRVSLDWFTADRILGLVGFLGLGMLWWRWSSHFWDWLGDLVPVGRKLQIELLRFVTSEPRAGSSLIVMVLLFICLLTMRRFHYAILQASLSIPIGLIILTVSFAAPQTITAFRTELDQGLVEKYLGSLDTQQAGAWLSRNSQPDDLIATNYLRDASGNLIDDYALAVWSGRAFFILGPKFGNRSEEERIRVNASEAFARGEATALERLQSFGVKWFVVDTRLTPNRQWGKETATRAIFANFWILELPDPD